MKIHNVISQMDHGVMAIRPQDVFGAGSNAMLLIRTDDETVRNVSAMAMRLAVLNVSGVAVVAILAHVTVAPDQQRHFVSFLNVFDNSGDLETLVHKRHLMVRYMGDRIQREQLVPMGDKLAELVIQLKQQCAPWTDENYRQGLAEIGQLYESAEELCRTAISR